MSNKQKILCTGSAGFIASNLIRKLMQERSADYEVVGMDWCRDGRALNHVYSNKGVPLYIGDFADAPFVDTVFQIEQPDIVLHLGAQSFVDDSIQNASAFVHSNVLGTQVLIDKSVKYKIKRFLLASTDEVLGQLVDDEKPWKEDAIPNPRNPYSATKLASEYLVKAASNTHGFQYYITRSCNNYGPRQHTRNFIPKTVKKLLNNECMTIFGTGLNVREWIYVDSNISGIMTVLEKGQVNEIYNISSGAEFTNLEVFNEICNCLEKLTGKNYHNQLQFVTDRAGHDFRYGINSNKLRALGWKPEIKFKQGLYQTIEWYLKNPWALE